MRKESALSRLALCALCVLSILGMAACGQVGAPAQMGAPGQDPVLTSEHPAGIVQDWSNHSLVYPRVGPVQSLIALQNDPRAVQSWQAAARRDWLRANSPRVSSHTHTSLRTDWNISLGGGSTAATMFPAKFTFDTSAAVAVANCTSDFIVFPVNVAGGAAQPNIVGLDNLYSGTAGSVGICNRVPVGGVDDGVSATTFWAYDINGAGGAVATSPALSLDGTKVAFVETVAATSAHFHVLAWKSGDGVPANLQLPATSPKVISSFSLTAPVAGAGTATDLVLGGAAGDTLSSPFVDFANDRAYVGNDAGVLFRIKNVFCTTGCTPGTSPAPSLDASWGTAGALTIGGSCTGVLGKLTGAVMDNKTGNIFVGCADGKLYGFTSAGAPITGSPLSVGNGTATGGIVDPPMVDPVNGFVYAESGSNAGSAVLFQAGTSSFTVPAPVKATLGAGGTFNLHSPAFNDNYFSNVTSTTWLLYALGPSAAGTQSTLYGITFSAGHAMTAGTPLNADTFGFGAIEFSPATEFLSAAAPSEDRLFESFLANSAGNLASFNISGAFPATLENFSAGAEGSGTTGIVVDNGSSAAQADSIYFGTLVSNTAVKLTQSTLQ